MDVILPGKENKVKQPKKCQNEEEQPKMYLGKVDNQKNQNNGKLVGKDARVMRSVRRSNEEMANLWHERLGHISWDNLDLMKRKVLVRGLPENIKQGKDIICDVCCEMKATRKPFKPIVQKRASELLELIHTDVCGPISPVSLGGNIYFATFTDDFSRRSEVVFMKRKSDVFDKFKIYKKRVERETGKRIKILRSDNGREYVNNAFGKFLEHHGIKHEKTQTYCPEQNGVSERLNRTLTEKARCLLRQANLPDIFWGEAVRAANFLRNHCPSKSCGEKVPIDWWMDRTPTVSYFKKFGCAAFVYIPKIQRSGKFGCRGKKMIFIGYCDDRKGYRFWDPEERKIVNSRNVTFNEADMRRESIKKDEEIEDDPEGKEVVITFATEGNLGMVGEIGEQLQGADVDEDEVRDQASIEISSDEDSVEEEGENMNQEEVVAEATPVAPTRELRVRTDKIRPTKYSAAVLSEQLVPEKTCRKLSEEEEQEDLLQRAGGSVSKLSKKQRRLARVKARKEGESGKTSEKIESKSTERRNSCTIDIFSKYGPRFED
jgi:transposase InsO family protein